MSELIISIDLGGTNCRFGLVADDGKVLRQEYIPVTKDHTPKGIINFLSEQCRRLAEVVSSNQRPTPARQSSSGGTNDQPFDSPGSTGLAQGERTNVRVAIGAPGIVDFERGTIVASPHYPNWKNFPLRDEMSKACGTSVVLDNDANMIALGEGWLGAGKGTKNFVMMTLGTGIGGGIIINGRVFHGDKGFAGEIGHIMIEPDGIKCDCGGKGCFETIVSAEGLNFLISRSKDPFKEKFLEQFDGVVDKITPKKLYNLAKEGDIFANIIWKKFGSNLGIGIASIVSVLGINTIVIGGGISNAWDFFIGEARREIAKRIYKETASQIIIKRSELGDMAGLLGCAKALKPQIG